MGFYFCGRYTDCDDKEVERDMFAAVSYFRGSYNRYGYEYQESQLRNFFSYFELTIKEKFLYAGPKLDGEAYYWQKDNHRLYRSWFLLQNVIYARYALHLHTISEPKFEQEPELESQQITDLFVEFRQILDDTQKLLASQTTKNDTSLESTILVEPEMLDESEPEFVAHLVPLQEVIPSRPIEVEVSYWDCCRSPNRVYHGAIIFTTYESFIVPETARRI